MTLRKFQQEIKDLSIKIANKDKTKEIFLSVCAGGGKSSVPSILADELINRGSFEKICWIAPRIGLVSQGEDDFVNSFIPHGLKIRHATNTGNLSRDREGYITTMQSVISSPQLHIDEISKYKYILFIDEFHFISENNVFKKKLSEMISKAELVIYASGTIERGAGDKVAYVPYNKDGSIDTRNTDTRKWIIYSRQQALIDKVITPLKFHILDGTGLYKDKDGIERKFDSLEDSSDRLKCALETGFSEQLLNKGLSIFEEQRYKIPTAKMIVVASSIELATQYKEYLRSVSKYKTEIATSKDSTRATKNIHNFKHGDIDILVGIGKFYIGFSVKEIVVITALTHIRSTPWLDQMQARSNRLLPNKDYGHIIAPADDKLKKYIKKLEREQIIYAESLQPEGKGQKNENPDEIRQIESLHSDIIGEEKPRIKLDSEQEQDLRKEITQTINKIINNKCKKIINGKEVIVKTNAVKHRKLLWARIMIQINAGRDEDGKLIKIPVAEMTIKQLEQVEKHLSIYLQ